jgi:hypothetical protein
VIEAGSVMEAALSFLEVPMCCNPQFALLNQNGIICIWQIATMEAAELYWLVENLPEFGARVFRENWVAQAVELAREAQSKQH